MPIRKLLLAIVIFLVAFASVLVPAEAAGATLGELGQPLTNLPAPLQIGAEPLIQNDLEPRLNVKIEQREVPYPELASMTPVNGSKEVDPGLTEINIVFARPMKRHLHAVVYEVSKADHTPEILQQSFDEAGRVYTLKVKLRPNWSYEFKLNAPGIVGFKSEEKIGLKPYEVRFQTGPAKQ